MCIRDRTDTETLRGEGRSDKAQTQRLCEATGETHRLFEATGDAKRDRDCER